MKKFELTILGTNAAYPAHGRFTSAQAVNYDNTIFIVDACEGLQIRTQQYKISPNKVQAVFISHLHGDHIFGLPGYLHSLNMNSRTKALTLYGPKGLAKYVESCLNVTQSHLQFDLSIEEFDPSIPNTLYNSEVLQISSFPLDHRIPCMGFLFQEQIPSYNIRVEKIGEYKLTIDEIKTAKNGTNIIRDDQIIPFEEVVIPKPYPRSYAYCSDTAYNLSLYNYINKVQVIYHETTYTQEFAELAYERKHSTSVEAATMALNINAQTLITGHYSPRYKYVDDIITEAKAIFPNTIKGYDGMIYKLPKNEG